MRRGMAVARLRQPGRRCRTERVRRHGGVQRALEDTAVARDIATEMPDVINTRAVLRMMRFEEPAVDASAPSSESGYETGLGVLSKLRPPEPAAGRCAGQKRCVQH